MAEVLLWYAFTLLLGWINLPLGRLVFKKLPSGGYHLFRPLGLLLWGFLFWILNAVGLMVNDLAGQLVVLFLLVFVNLFILWKTGAEGAREWIGDHRRFIVISEVLFLLAFLLWALVRAANPDIIHTEKFMEMGFINAILKSPTLPPLDPWLSGYSISYYYFGYLLSAMLIRVTGVDSSIGYNLVSSMWFALTALGAYGVLWDLLLIPRRKHAGENQRERHGGAGIYTAALLAPLLMLIVSNWFGTLDVAHSRGFGWGTQSIPAQASDFWQDLDIPELTLAPGPATWRPDRGGWSWWQGSRVVQDVDLLGNRREVIDEFPFFTYLLADIHPHMLGMPFVLLAVGQALNALLGGWAGSLKLGKRQTGLDPVPTILSIVTLGGIAFMNTWDFPFYLALIAACLAYRRCLRLGWSWARVREFLLLCLVGGVLSIAVYLPFYLSFSSQAGGIIPSLAFFTKGKYFWIMFGPLVVPILTYLGWRFLHERKFKQAGLAAGIVLGLIALLFVVSWGLGLLSSLLPGLNQLLLGLQGAQTTSGLLTGAILERLRAPGTVLTLAGILFLAVSLLTEHKRQISGGDDEGLTEPDNPRLPGVFIMFMIVLGALLVLVPEFIYLRDQFSVRMNTIFKFYFQAWILWSLAASYAIVELFRHVKDNNTLYAVFLVIILILGAAAIVLGFDPEVNARLGAFGSSPLDYIILAIPVVFVIWAAIQALRRNYTSALAVISLLAVAGGLVYPVLELWNKTEGFNPTSGYSLDGKQDFYLSAPDAMAAAEWLAEAPLGVMVEAVAEHGGSYTTYNLISTFSGMPSVLGWVGHEDQWRGGRAEIGTRQADIEDLYSTRSWERALSIIDMYNIRYIVVGQYERNEYQLSEDKFIENAELVFDTAITDIYEIKPE